MNAQTDISPACIEQTANVIIVSLTWSRGEHCLCDTAPCAHVAMTESTHTHTHMHTHTRTVTCADGFIFMSLRTANAEIAQTAIECKRPNSSVREEPSKEGDGRGLESHGALMKDPFHWLNPRLPPIPADNQRATLLTHRFPQSPRADHHFIKRNGRETREDPRLSWQLSRG